MGNGALQAGLHSLPEGLFAFGGFQQTIQAMKRAVNENGCLGIGETYWLSNQVPPDYAQKQTTTYTEAELAQFARNEGFELEYIIRASRDDWDRYISDNWVGLLRWLEENPNHPDYEQVLQHFRADQDDYLQFQSQYMGWALYCLSLMKSHPSPPSQDSPTSSDQLSNQVTPRF